MITYYCHTLEEALKKAKAAGKKPGCRYGGIVLKSGKKGFAIKESTSKFMEILGDNFDAALADPDIETYLRKAEELFGRTSTSEKSGVPRFIGGQRWLVPETDDMDALQALIRTELGL